MAHENVELIDLARMAHTYENHDNDVDFMSVMDEVNRRDKMHEFRKLYLKVWGEFKPKQVEKIKCKCPCHKNKNIKHVMPCCDNGYINFPSHTFDTTIF